MKTNSLKRTEWVVGILLTVAILFLLVVRATHAGGLWRDECAVVQLARMPAFTDILKNFQYEAFPIPFHLLIRGYTNICGASDAAFRVFGFVVGVMLIAMLWFIARLRRGDPPLLSLVLLGLNTSILTWATSIRGYGLGCVLILLTFGLIVKAQLQPTYRWALAAFLASLASVHCLLYNSVLLLGMVAAATVVFLVRWKWKRALIAMTLGALAGASVLPYVGAYSGGREWDMLVKYAIDLPWLWEQFNDALGAPSVALCWAWHVVFAAFVAGAIWQLRKFRRDRPAPEWDLLLFGLVTILTVLVGYGAFLIILSYVTSPWYYLALMCILAATFDLFGEYLVRIRWMRVARLGLVILALIALPFAAWPKVKLRQTNIDLLARHLEKDAKTGDLIVMSPWFYGVSFNRYYHGTVPWVTLPMIHEHRTHRFDLVKEKMMSPAPLADLEGEITRTLRAGGRVWIVGQLTLPEKDETPFSLPPAPAPKADRLALAKSHTMSPQLQGDIAANPWLYWPYDVAWSQQIGLFMQQHAPKRGVIEVPTASPVNKMEKVSLLVAEGWQ